MVIAAQTVKPLLAYSIGDTGSHKRCQFTIEVVFLLDRLSSDCQKGQHSLTLLTEPRAIVAMELWLQL